MTKMFFETPDLIIPNHERNIRELSCFIVTGLHLQIFIKDDK